MNLKNTFQNYHNGLKENILKPMQMKIDLVGKVVEDQIVPMDIINDKFIRKTADGFPILSETWSTINEIQGNTKFSKNLIPFPYNGNKGAGHREVLNGVAFTVQEDGGIYISGKATETVYYNLCQIDFGTESSRSEAETKNGFYFSKCKYDANNNCTFIDVDPTEGWVSTIVYPMVSFGLEPVPYERYWEGPKDACIQQIKSSNKNLINLDLFVNGTSLVKNIDGTYTFTKNSDSRFSNQVTLYLPENSYWIPSAKILSIYNPNVGNVDSSEYAIAIRYWLSDSSTDTAGVNAKIGNSTGGYRHNTSSMVQMDLYLSNEAPDGYSITFTDFMINFGTEVVPYQPYEESVMTFNEPLTLGKYQTWKENKIYDYSSEIHVKDYEIQGLTKGYDPELGYQHDKYIQFEIAGFKVPDSVVDNEEALLPQYVYNNHCIKFTYLFPSHVEINCTPMMDLESFKEAIATLDPVIKYKSSELINVTDCKLDNGYKVWNEGLEQINCDKDVLPTITNKYYSKTNEV